MKPRGTGLLLSGPCVGGWGVLMETHPGFLFLFIKSILGMCACPCMMGRHTHDMACAKSNDTFLLHLVETGLLLFLSLHAIG